MKTNVKPKLLVRLWLAGVLQSCIDCIVLFNARMCKKPKRLGHLLQVWPARLRVPLLLRRVCVDRVELNCVTHA